VNEKGIALHVPVIDKSKRDDGTFSRKAFIYDKGQDINMCPSRKRSSGTGQWWCRPALSSEQPVPLLEPAVRPYAA
jgi:hypothetical protein